MASPVTCVRLYTDRNGESHLDEVEIGMSSVQYAPPAPPLEISEPAESKRYSWLRFPKGWNDDAHPTPRRQLLIVLEGEIEGRTSAGEVRIFRPGDRLLMEDTSGKGHGSRPLNGEALALVIALE